MKKATYKVSKETVPIDPTDVIECGNAIITR